MVGSWEHDDVKSRLHKIQPNFLIMWRPNNFSRRILFSGLTDVNWLFQTTEDIIQ